jgi:transposase
VPAKLSARARLFDTNQARKTDPADAHCIAVAALRTGGLRQVTVEDTAVALKLLVDRRDSLGRARTEVLNRLHQLLLELVPGGAKQFLSAPQARTLLSTVRPRDIVGRTRRQLASELITEVAVIDKKIKAANAQLTELVAATGSTLQDLVGIGPSGAARLLGDIGDIGRFANRDHFASWNGTAPIDASSGDQHRHRLSRAGNRRINRVLHIMAIVQLRRDTDGRAYYRRKLAAGKSPLEALRALKRRLSNVVYQHMVNDAKRSRTSPAGTGPGGQSGATLTSSAAGPIPTAGTSDKPLPGPVTVHPRTRRRPAA